MKRFFTLAALLISVVSFAAPLPRAGRIIISNSDNSIIQVRINGRSYNVNEQPLLLNNLSPGRHQVQIFKSERKPYGYSRSAPVLIYNAAVYVDPSYIVDLNINRRGKVVIGKSVLSRKNDRYDDRYENRKYEDSRYEDSRFEDYRYDDEKSGSHGDRSDDSRKSYPGDNNKPAFPGRTNRPDRS